MSAHAIFMPARENYFQAVAEAMAIPDVAPECRLYLDAAGERLAWLPKPTQGWQPVGGVSVKHLEAVL